ncbi:MAG: 2-C-methyl-D-erythritol 4-phosphate cytidylyltransferase [Mariprofundaceae bacterium]
MGTIVAMRVTVLLLCAGASRRFGGDTPKTYVEAAGEPLLLHCLKSLGAEPRITAVQPVIAGNDGRFSTVVAGRRFPFELLPAVHGGAERADSMAAGLRALADDVEWVAVHDAARPMPTPRLLKEVLDMAKKNGAAAPGLPVTDTIKRVDADSKVGETLSRDCLRAVQTPQVARRAWFLDAMKQASGRMRDYTDDASLLEGAGYPVYISQGDAMNRKITTPDDFDWLASQLRGGRA